MQKPYPIYDQNQLKLIPDLRPKELKNDTFWRRIFLYGPHKGVAQPPHPLPPPGHSVRQPELTSVFLYKRQGHATLKHFVGFFVQWWKSRNNGRVT